MTQCTRCGSRMNYNDETTKLTESACPHRHNHEIVQKESLRVTAQSCTVTAPGSAALYRPHRYVGSSGFSRCRYTATAAPF
jgi:hypothetical protein